MKILFVDNMLKYLKHQELQWANHQITFIGRGSYSSAQLNKQPSKIGCLGLQGAFWKIRQKQIQIYPQTSIEPKYGEFYLKNGVSAHG